MQKNLLFTGGRIHAGGRLKMLAAFAVFCCLFAGLPLGVSAQARHTVSGVVMDDQGPVAGATVIIKGGTAGTITAANGEYSIQASPDNTIVISSIGYVPQEITVGDRATINVTLESDTTVIEDVVVVGYGVQKKSLVTGAISQVKGADLEKTGIANAGETLAGKVAGVQVISDSGQPGAGVQMVVRGVGTNGSNTPLYVVDGMSVSGIGYLNPSDIESIEILKDAAAAAIYGARGANGVILITTRKGSEGSFSIDFGFTYGISNLPRKLSLLNAKEYTIIRNEMSVNGGGSPQFSDDEINFYNKGTDWQEAILNRNAPTTQYNLSMVGGTKRSSYSLSASYLDQNGIFADGKSNYKRYTASFNGEQKFLRGDVLKVGQNIIASRVIDKSITNNTILAGPITAALNMDPLTPVYDDYTKYDDYVGNEEFYDLYNGFAYSRHVSSDYTNPAALVHFANPDSYWTTVKANVYAELTVLKDIKIRGSVGADMTWTQTYSYTQPRRYNPTTVYNTNNSTSQSSAESQAYNTDLYITWGRVFKDVHDVTVMAGMQTIQNKSLSLSASRDGLLTTDPDRAYLTLAKGDNYGASGGPGNPYNIVSFFGRASYAYDNRYLITATIRRDGSTRFGPNNRYGTFPSVSVGWNVSNESFMKSAHWLDYLKLRASWGQNGNDRISNFMYLSTISQSSQLGYVFGSNTATTITTGGAPTTLANPNIKWETSEQFNIGIDATFLRDWTVTFDYYIKTTKDQLVGNSPIPLFMGQGAPTVNAGNVRNSGVEFMLEWRKKLANGLFISASGNIAYNKNEVKYVGTDSGFVSGMSVSGITGDITRMEEGYPMGYFRGYKVDGVFQNWDQINSYTWTNPDSGATNLIQPKATPGDLIFRDNNNDGVIDTQDMTMIGNPYPKVIYGINLNASWKNIDLTINTSGAAGHQVYSAVRRNMSANNWGTWVLDRWTGEGTSNKIPRLSDKDDNGNWSNSSELYVHDADYFRIRNLTIGYTFNIPEKYYIQKIRVFFAVNNLATFTKYNRGYDPEIGSSSPLNVGTDLGNYPRARTTSFGINLTF